MEKRHIAIVGTGSIAAALGWNLAKFGFEFYFIGRGGPVDASFKFNVNNHVTAFEAKVPDVLSKTGLVFFCVKAYDLALAFKHLNLFTHEVVAVSLGNGAVQQLIEDGQQTFKQHIFRPGYSTFAVNKQKDDVFILRSFSGEFQFGPLRISDCVSDIEKELVVNGPPFVWNPRIKLYQQRKWLFNTVINTLTAANRLGCNGDLLVDMPMLTAVFGEAYQLGEELWGPWSFARSDLFAAMVKLIEDTASNENSMAADVRNGRKTESLFLAGLAVDKDSSRYPLLSSLHDRIQSCGFTG